MGDVGEVDGELARHVGLDRDHGVAAGAAGGAQAVQFGLRGRAGVFGLDPALGVRAALGGDLDELRGDGPGHLRDPGRVGRALGQRAGQPVAGAQCEPLEELLAGGVARVGAVDRGERPLGLPHGLLGGPYPFVGRGDEVAAHHVDPDDAHGLVGVLGAARDAHRVVEQRLRQARDDQFVRTCGERHGAPAGDTSPVGVDGDGDDGRNEVHTGRP